MTQHKSINFLLFAFGFSASAFAQIEAEPKEYLTMAIVRTKWSRGIGVIFEKDEKQSKLESLTVGMNTENHYEK